MRRWTVVLLAITLAACGTADSEGVLRREHYEGETIGITASPARKPVQLTEEEFEAGLRLAVADLHLRASRPESGRIVLASWQPGIGTQDEVTRDYRIWCERMGNCIPLSNGFLGADERRSVALDIALGQVWAGAAEAVKDMMDPAQLRVMVVTTLTGYMLLVAAPEPVSKIAAVHLTWFLLGYLGVDTLWSLVDGWKQMRRDAETARSFAELRAAGERFGKLLGTQAARALVMLATAALGSTLEVAFKASKLPGFALASRLLKLETGGLGLEAVGQVRTIALAGGRVTASLTSGTVAMAAPANGSRPHDHHISTNKNSKSEVRGGPWTPLFEKIFAKAGMTLDDPENIVPVEGHKGPHPEEYHEEVFRRLDAATADCQSMAECRQALTQELRALAKEIFTPGTLLNKLVTKGAQHQGRSP